MQKILDKSDPRVYDLKSYDINSFESSGGHNHPGTELDDYFEKIFPADSVNFSDEKDECKEKLMKITNS